MCVEASTVPNAIFDDDREDNDVAHLNEFGDGGGRGGGDGEEEEESVENIKTQVGEALGIDVVT